MQLNMMNNRDLHDYAVLAIAKLYMLNIEGSVMSRAGPRFVQQ